MTDSNSFAPDPYRKLPPKARWNARYSDFGNAKLAKMREPRELLQTWLPKFPTHGLALDVAAGAGRHSLALADHGLRVHAVDISIEGLKLLNEKKSSVMNIQPIVLNLEQRWLPKAMYQVIVNFLYLERSILPIIRQRLIPNGWLIMETFTVDQLKFPHKKHIQRDFLLEHDELRDSFSDWDILFYEEGLHKENYSARLVARKPA